MRVVLPLVSAANHISGVQRHAVNAAVCLLQSPEITSLHLIAGPWQQYLLDALPAATARDARLKTEFVSVRNTVVRRNAWYYEDLPRICRSHNAEIVHLAYPVPVRRSAYSAGLVVSLHDLYPYDLPENFGFPKVLFNRFILRQCLRAVDAIACVSHTTQQRLKGLEPALARTRSVTIPNMVERGTMEPLAPSFFQARDRFLLCVAQHRRNKNILLLLQSYLHLLRSGQISADTRLVIVGIDGPETQAIYRFLRTHLLEQSVVLLAGISEGELQWCYQHCSVLVSPSSVEGFGLPVAEGVLAGCRIVCSDIPAHREVGREVCHYFALGDCAVPALGAAIVQQMALPRPVPRDLPNFSAPFISSQYIRLYQSLLYGESPTSGTHSVGTLRAEERELEV